MAIIDFLSKRKSKEAPKTSVSIPGKPVTTPGRPVTSDPMHPAIAEIKRAFDASDFKYSIDHSLGQWDLIAGVSGKHNSYKIKFILKDNAENDLAIRVFDLATAPQSKLPQMYRLINDLHRKYRFLRFTINDEGAMNLEVDLPNCTQNVGAIAVEYLIRIMRAVDEEYPLIMQTMWS